MKLYYLIITIIVYQYFITPITIDARPAVAKRFSWDYPIHDYQPDNYFPPLVKRKGVGWGKRNDLTNDDALEAKTDDVVRKWLDDK